MRWAVGPRPESRQSLERTRATSVDPTRVVDVARAVASSVPALGVLSVAG
jgi:hypothetical protein